MSDEEREDPKFRKVTLTLATAVYDQVKEVVDGRDGATITSVVNELLQYGLDQAPPWVVKDRSLDDACETILQALPETQRNLIREVSAERNRPIAAFIMSYVLLAIEQGRTAQLMAEYADPGKLSLTSLHEQYQGEMRTCDYCRAPFKAKKIGERYCPPPAEGESCGTKAYKAEYEARRKARHRASDLAVA
jgi:hypothetical protein